MTTQDSDLRLAPVAAAAWAAMWIATSGSMPLVAGGAGLACVLAAVAWWRRSWLLLAVVVIIAAGLALGSARHADRHHGVLPELAADNATVTLQAQISSDPRVGLVGRQYVHAGAVVREVTVDAPVPGGPALPDDAGLPDDRGFPGDEAQPGDAAVRTWRVREPVVLVVTGEQAEQLRTLPVGTRVETRARLASADRTDHVSAIARTPGPLTVVAPPGASLRMVEHVRAGLRDSLVGAPGHQRALVPALVLGDTSAMTPQLREDFVRTGLTHLTAVSGANLTYLLVFVTVAARALGVRGRWLQVIGLLGVVVFVALCRTEPSVLRAAAMGVVTLTALSVVGTPLRGVPRRGVRHLSLAVLLLVLIDPWLSRSIGFVLSVSASAGIIVWSNSWAQRLATWMPALLAEAIAVPLAAQLATQPVVTVISGEISLVGLVANALAGPAVGPATVLGFAAAGVAVLHPFPAMLLATGAGWAAQLIIWVAQLGAALPGAAISWPASTLAVIWLVAAVLVAVLVVPWLLRRRWTVLLVALVLALAVVRGPTPPGWPPPHWAVVACDVGQGDAFVLRAAPGQAVLIDTGPDPTLLRSCLRELGITRVPLVVLTHFHADHIGGLAGLDDLPVDVVLVSPLASPASDADRVQRAHPGRIQVAVPGQLMQVGDVTWRVTGPEWVPDAVGDSDGESAAENDASISGIAEVGGIRILFTGDLTANGQQQLGSSPDLVAVDVLKVPHHGSADFDPDLLTASNPRIAVISVGERNGYGHPAPRLLRALDQRGIQVARTDQHGALALSRTDNGIQVIGRDPSPHP